VKHTQITGGVSLVDFEEDSLFISPHSASKTLDVNDSGFRFEGTDVIFADGARWLIKEPLSDVKLQRMRTHCEATQVFTCTLLEDPAGHYRGIGEAVMKVKFQ
jgi:3-oxoacyl-[acyl-carrier-protein] synthase III